MCDAGVGRYRTPGHDVVVRLVWAGYVADGMVESTTAGGGAGCYLDLGVEGCGVICVDVELGGRRSLVRIGAGLLAEAGPLLAQVGGRGRVLVVSDHNVAPRYAQRVTGSLEGAGFSAALHLIPPGDQSKSLAEASAIYDRLAAGNYARDATVLAVGGGVVSDLAGFVAGTWMRGANLVICPTTLEADVDASVGGKTAVNHPAGKNLIGVFHQPGLVIVDPSCLESLADRDMAAGMAESVKHAAISDGEFLDWQLAHRDAILSRTPAVLEQLIERNVRIKAGVVTRDERDQAGIRAALNFGHTIGHALEAWWAYDRRHGECVALGMVAACRMSVRMGLLDTADERRVVETIGAFGLPVSLDAPPPADRILEYITHDKKAAGDRVHFVLLDGIGQAVLRPDVPDSVVVDALTALGGG